MQIFVTGLLQQCRRFGLHSELIIVEWNPPSDRPKLAEALTWPVQPGPCVVRIIEVPENIHRRFKHSEKLSLFQMIAKNVGIRRARGQFVLATNIDVLFSDDLVRFLSDGGLLENAMYRIDRHDAPATVPPEATIQQQLEFCRRNVIRVNQRDGTFKPKGLLARWLKRRRNLASVEFQRRMPSVYLGLARTSHAWTWFVKKSSRLFSWIRVWFPYRFHWRSLFDYRALGSYFMNRLRLLRRICVKLTSGRRDDITLPVPNGINWREYWLRVDHEEQDSKRAQMQDKDSALHKGLVRTLREDGTWPGEHKKEIPRRLLHTNACGDFTLLSRKRWHDLRGYPEWEMYSFNIDSFLCYSAYYGGAEEIMLEDPCRFYHIEHESGWTPEQSVQLRSRMEHRGIPWFDWLDCVEWIEHMQFQQAPAIVNNEAWGLASAKLHEIVIGTPDASRSFALATGVRP
jgi:hypothetical protein